MSTNQPAIFFIVGNSRSGTTMMLRILDNHPEIYGLNELHFFEQLWSAEDMERKIGVEKAVQLAARLLFVQRDGYIGKTDSTKYRTEAEKLVEEMGLAEMYPHEVYAFMMQRETRMHGRSHPCEKTPQNVFYLAEIFKLFPDARVINMVRDPRAVMLSQKRKWKRRGMGATFITRWEVIRLRINYHPITISRLWNSAIRASMPFHTDPRVLTVHFEDIMTDPEGIAKQICEHLKVEYLPEILNIPQASSSNEADSKERGINKQRAGNWKKGGLTNTEIYWCERICGDLMKANGYNLEAHTPNLFIRAFYILTFPVKIGMALLINLNRMKNIRETIRKRLK